MHTQLEEIVSLPPFLYRSLYYSASTRKPKTPVRYWWNSSKQQNREGILWIFQPTSTFLHAHCSFLRENKRSEVSVSSYIRSLKPFACMMNSRWTNVEREPFYKFYTWRWFEDLPDFTHGSFLCDFLQLSHCNFSTMEILILIFERMT